MPTAIYNLSGPRAANGQSYTDSNLSNGREIYLDWSGPALDAVTISAVRLRWYGSYMGGGGTANILMNGVGMSAALAHTGSDRQECLAGVSGFAPAAFALSSGTLVISLALASGAYFRISSWARLEVDYTPNTSRLSLSAASVAAGSGITASVTSYSPAYAHRLTLTLGSRSQTWNLSPGATQQAVTVPMAWLDQMPQTSVATATVRLETLSGGAVIGTASSALTVTAPASSGPTFGASCAPLYEVDGVIYPSPTGGYVKGKSGVSAQLTDPAGRYGATIARTSVNVGSLEGGGYNAAGPGALSLSSGLLPSAGPVDVVFRVTDSRGITTERVITLEVADYTPPVMTTLTGARCDSAGVADSMGTSCLYAVAWTYSPLGGANDCAASLSLRAKGSGDEWAVMTSDASSGQSGVLSDASGPAELAPESAWELRLTLADAYGPVHFVATVPSARFVRTVSRRLNAVAYGKAAEHPDSFEVAQDMSVYFHGKELLDLIHPVGSIYMSMADVSPAVLFGGEWERVEGRFLLAAGADDQAGDTGGAASHALTQEELPNISLTALGEPATNAPAWSDPYQAVLYRFMADVPLGSVNIPLGGSGKAFGIMPPYLAVHVWKRTA